MSAVGPAHRAQEQDHTGRAAHNSLMEVGSIRCHLNRGSLFIPLGLNRSTRSDASQVEQRQPLVQPVAPRTLPVQEGNWGTILCSSLTSLRPLLLLWLVSALLCHSLAANRPPRSLPLSSNTYGDCSCPQFSPAHPEQQITAFAGCQLTETSCKMQALCSHLNHLAAFHSPLPSPPVPLVFTVETAWVC